MRAEGAGSALVSPEGERVEFVGSLSIGRSPANDLAIEHRRISSRHALIESDGNRWQLKDLASRNGTSLNKRRLTEPRPIKPGDVIRFAGVSRWTVERLADPAGLGCTSTEPIEGRPAPIDVELHLEASGPGEGTIRVLRGQQEWTLHTGQRFALLWLLAEQAGQWVDDDQLKRRIWGRVGADLLDRSTLYKLVHDTRRMLRTAGVEGNLVDKEGGRTRLALPPSRVQLEEQGPSET